LWRIVGLIALISLTSRIAETQSVATIRLAVDSIASDAQFCDLQPVRKPQVGDGATTLRDTLFFQFYEDANFSKAAAPRAKLVSLLDLAAPHDIDPTKTVDTLALEHLGLSGRTVTVKRRGLDTPLCILVPKPTPVTSARTALRTTQFIADGAVSAALRTGDVNQSATGSLGIDHLDIKGPGERPRPLLKIPIIHTISRGNVKSHKLGWKSLWPLSSERLRALITVASSVDTLEHSKQYLFRQALLAPALVGHGRSGSGSIDYYAATGLRDGQHGPHLNFTFSRGAWRVKNTELLLPGRPDTASLSATVTLASVDARWRWTPIEQARDPKGNDFAFSIEGGWTWRTIAGDARTVPGFLEAALGSKRSKYSGPSAAFIITLRQVTATADLPFLRSYGKRLEGLSGMQPIVTLNFSAPVFTF
jgi:hypothetical protein